MTTVAPDPREVEIFERWAARYRIVPNYEYSVSASEGHAWSATLVLPDVWAHGMDDGYLALPTVSRASVTIEIPAPGKFLSKDEIRDGYPLREEFMEWARSNRITHFVMGEKQIAPPDAFAKEPAKLDIPKSGETMDVDGLDLQ